MVFPPMDVVGVMIDFELDWPARPVPQLPELHPRQMTCSASEVTSTLGRPKFKSRKRLHHRGLLT